LYQATFHQILTRCQPAAAARGQRKFGIQHELLSLDSSRVEWCAEVFDWAQYQRAKGAWKLHLVLDQDGYLPCSARGSEGQLADLTAAREIPFAPGTVVVFDRGYSDSPGWLTRRRAGIPGVTRRQDSAVYGVVESRSVPPGSNIQRDEIMLLTSPPERGPQARLRRIAGWVEEQGETRVLVTNDRKLAARTIARLYQERWQVEWFFQALQQGLKGKTFVGTSENAVQIQIWTALIAMRMIKSLQRKSSFGWSLSNRIALLRQQLLVYRDRWTWLKDPFQAPPQPALAQQMRLKFA
jgi:hypothetical protein